MTKLTFEPLQSLRVAQYAIAQPCGICETGNNADAFNCRHCHAPMALSHQMGRRRTLPKLITVMGPPDAGKTTWLGLLLDTLSRQSDQFEMLLQGAASISLQQKVIQELSHCQFPEPTSSHPCDWNWVHAQVTAWRRRQVEIAIPDIAGKWWLDAATRESEGEVVQTILKRSAGLLILIDARRLDGGDSEPDFLAMKMLSNCHSALATHKSGSVKQPISFVFTKAENCPMALANPAEFARLRAPGLFKLAKQYLTRHAYFATSIVAAEGYQTTSHGRRQCPLRIEPRNIPDAFQWLVQHL